MPLFFPHDTKTQNQQTQSSAAAKQPALQTMANQHSKSKSRQTAAMQVISPAHTYTPGNSLCTQKYKKEPSEFSGRFFLNKLYLQIHQRL